MKSGLKAYFRPELIENGGVAPLHPTEKASIGLHLARWSPTGAAMKGESLKPPPSLGWCRGWLQGLAERLPVAAPSQSQERGRGCLTVLPAA